VRPTRYFLKALGVALLALLFAALLPAVVNTPRRLLLKLTVEHPARSMLTTEARTSYPWPLLLGNALWGVIAYAKDRETMKPQSRPRWLYGAALTYLIYTMPANIFTCLLFLGKTPGAFVSATILPVHLACAAALELFPSLAAALGAARPFLILDSLGVLDNVTTQMNFMEEAHAKYGTLLVAVLAGMCTNLAGGVARHFAKHGFAEGGARFDQTLGDNVRFSLGLNVVYAYFALHRCGGDTACSLAGPFQVIHLYELLPWLAVVRNARGHTI